MNIYTAGVQTTTEIHLLILKAIEEKGIKLNDQQLHTINEYTNQPWDYVLSLDEDSNKARTLFQNEIKQWRSFSFNEISWKEINDEAILCENSFN